jgi:methylmalonyl-CoA epimerase
MAALRRTASSLFTRSAGAWQRAAGACELAEASHAQRPPLRRASSSSSSEGARAGRLNHVAIAVPDLAQAAERFKLVLGAAVSEPQALPEHGVRVVFVQLDNTKLELLEPLSASSPIAKFLEKNPVGGVHHLCLEVNDIQVKLAPSHSCWGGSAPAWGERGRGDAHPTRVAPCPCRPPCSTWRARRRACSTPRRRSGRTAAPLFSFTPRTRAAF